MQVKKCRNYIKSRQIFYKIKAYGQVTGVGQYDKFTEEPIRYSDFNLLAK
jgi:hypothetical protein